MKAYWTPQSWPVLRQMCQTTVCGQRQSAMHASTVECVVSVSVVFLVPPLPKLLFLPHPRHRLLRYLKHAHFQSPTVAWLAPPFPVGYDLAFHLLLVHFDWPAGILHFHCSSPAWTDSQLLVGNSFLLLMAGTICLLPKQLVCGNCWVESPWV